MRILPILSFLILPGCASTRQTMPPATGELAIRLETKGSQRAGPVIVVVGCQVGVTSKPVGVDALNPLLSPAANLNSPNGTAKGGDIVPLAPKKGDAALEIPPGEVSLPDRSAGAVPPAGKPQPDGRSSTREVPATPGGG